MAWTSPAPALMETMPPATPEPLLSASVPPTSDEVYTEDQIQSMLAFGITPSEYLMRAQARLNSDARRRMDYSKVSSMTFETAMADAHEALTGVTADLTGATDRTNLKEIVTYGNRLRGLGILCITAAMVGLVVDYLTRA